MLGGARSGKSSFAEQLLAREREVDYVACGLVPDGSDPEWTDRIALHRARRPASWRTVETVDLPAVLGRPGPPVLVDCLTTWLARVMDDCGVWSEAPAPTPGSPRPSTRSSPRGRAPPAASSR